MSGPGVEHRDEAQRTDQLGQRVGIERTVGVVRQRIEQNADPCLLLALVVLGDQAHRQRAVRLQQQLSPDALAVIAVEVSSVVDVRQETVALPVVGCQAKRH